MLAFEKIWAGIFLRELLIKGASFFQKEVLLQEISSTRPLVSMCELVQLIRHALEKLRPVIRLAEQQTKLLRAFSVIRKSLYLTGMSILEHEISNLALLQRDIDVTVLWLAIDQPDYHFSAIWKAFCLFSRMINIFLELCNSWFW
jgi:hypothetical protein